MRLVPALVFVAVVTSTASAQSAYVGAALIGDIVRVSGSNFDRSSGNGETFGGALRAGAPLGERWGVELEFAYTGRIEASPSAIRAGRVPGITFDAPLDASVIFPVPQFSSERQLSTVSTLLWWSHEVSQSVSLVYLGGVAFTRTEWDVRLGFPEPLPLPSTPIGGGIQVFPVFDQESVSYGADAAVGFEARIGMTEHLRLVPGIRLQTAAGGWAIRPGIGVQWMF